jgi:hypothetical protein
MVLGHPVHLEPKGKGDNSIPETRRAPDVAVGNRAARPVRHGESYTCLNSNLRSVYGWIHWEKRLTTSAARVEVLSVDLNHLFTGRRWAMSPFKGMSGAPNAHYHSHNYRTVGSPTAREGHGDGASVVVRGRESRLHGEGKQVTSTPIAERYA